MNKRRQDGPELTVEETERYNVLADGAYNEKVYSKGITRLTKNEWPIRSVRNASQHLNPATMELDDSYVSLEYESLEELFPNHGWDVVHGILRAEGFFTGERDASSLAAEINANMTSADWTKIGRSLSKLDDEKDDSGKRAALLIALWAELFAEKGGPLWLAAMAWHALVVNKDQYAFAYLTAFLDQKRHNETDLMRGKDSVRNASEGGQATARKTKPLRDKILFRMNEYMKAGKSVPNAALLTCTIHGLGTSKEANIKRWYRPNNPYRRRKE